ncbi:MAG: hypothetical protein EOP84_26715 [Verrucomicrobiaceae bacterium]|nr:MAG: hypothetical protein EOP84_26715 [Verrucomicrobiaceae bacterium]
MGAIAATGGLSDVKIRWSHLMNGTIHSKKKGGETFPALAALISHVVSPDLCQHSVLIKLPDADTMYEIREWLEEHAKAKYSIFGRYEWTDLGVRVTRDVKGLKFSFEDEDMAVFFKFRWASGL